MLSLLKSFSNTVGFHSLVESPRDTKILCAQRFVRLFAYGGPAIFLGLHLGLLGISAGYIGQFLTLTLLGDVLISLMLTLVADALGRKNILILGAALMIASGVTFSLAENYWILLAAAVFGVISPSGNEIGPFRAIEESTLAQITAKDRRSDIFAWYTLIGFSGAALGSMTTGWFVARLRSVGWTDLQAYRAIFVGYAVFGLLKLALALCLSNAVEQVGAVKAKDNEEATDDENGIGRDDPEQPLLGPQSASPPQSSGSPSTSDPGREFLEDTTSATSSSPPSSPSRFRSLIPRISAESRRTVLQLSLLFALDSFASGLVPTSFLSIFYTNYHHLAPGPLGTFFAASSTIAALSNLFSPSLARHLGLIPTMVFTHLPSSIFLALVPVPDNNHTLLSMASFLLRSCTATMDAAPRQAFLSQVVLDAERTAVMGVVNVIKTLAQSVGPSVTGALFERGSIWVPFVVAGALKATYDLGIAGLFWTAKARED